MDVTDIRDVIQNIVVNYKTPNDLSDFLNSYAPNPQNILYIANVQPEEQDLKTTEQHLQPADHHITFEENVGYARAVNYCSAQEQTKYIGIFNADIILTPGFLELAADIMDQHPDWGVLGPRQINEAGKITAAGIFGTNEHPQHRGWQQPDNLIYHDIRTDSVTVAGSAMIVRRECWDQMKDCDIFQEVFPGAGGAFLPTPHFYEETGFCYHLRHHGWKAVYYGPSKIIHKWHQASPVGGWAEQQIPVSQAIFRNFCDRHSILHD